MKLKKLLMPLVLGASLLSNAACSFGPKYTVYEHPEHSVSVAYWVEEDKYVVTIDKEKGIYNQIGPFYLSPENVTFIPGYNSGYKFIDYENENKPDELYVYFMAGHIDKYRP